MANGAPRQLAHVPWFDVADVLNGDDPYAAFDELRERAPFWRSDFGLHVLGYDASVELLRDVRFHHGVPQMLDGSGIHDPIVRRQWLTALLGSPKADHDRMRRLLSPAFTPKAIGSLRAYVSAVSEQAAARASERGHLEVMRDLAAGIPPAVFCHMIGAPPSDAPFVGRVSAAILEIFARRPELGPSIEAATHELMEYVAGFIERRRAEPRAGDLLSSLLAAEEQGERLSTEELVAIVIEVLEASTDNTSSQLALVLHAATQHPGAWERLRSDPARIPAFVEEASRLWPRITGISKVATTDLVFGDVAIAGGTVLFATVPSAHRDPRNYVEPLRFDPERQCRTLNLNYGAGPHHCIGASLARVEMCGALEVLTRRWGAIREIRQPELDFNVGVVTVRSLDLEVEPA